jgi:hypothetical protein
VTALERKPAGGVTYRQALGDEASDSCDPRITAKLDRAVETLE